MRNRGLEAAALLIILSAATNILILVESAPPATITFNSPHTALAPTNATGVYYLAEAYTYASLTRSPTLDTYSTLTCVSDGHTWGTLGYSCATAGQETHILYLTKNTMRFNATGASTVLVYTPEAGEVVGVDGPASSTWSGSAASINTVAVTGPGVVTLTWSPGQNQVKTDLLRNLWIVGLIPLMGAAVLMAGIISGNTDPEMFQAVIGLAVAAVFALVIFGALVK